MPDPLRVALLTVSADNVGPTRALLMLARGLDRRRFAPHFITAVRPGPTGRAALESLDIPVASLDTRGAVDVRGIWRLARLLRQWRIDLVHAKLQRAAFYARTAAPLAGRPVVLTNVTNMYSDHFTSQHGAPLGRALLAVDRATRSLVDVWVANSAAAAADVAHTLGVPGQRIPVVPNAIDADHFVRSGAVRAQVRAALGVDSASWVIGCVARLVPLKQIDLLIDAASAVRAHVREAVLLIVGDGPARQQLTAYAAASGVRAIFTGERSDVADLLAACDVFAFPSSSEGQPNVVLEAMAAGLPIVVPAIPGIDELVEPDVSALVVAPGAAPLAEALTRLHRNPSEAAALGEAARLRVEQRFSPARVVAAFERIYLDAAAGRA